jgi:protein-tyrosine-phosphatase
MSPRGVAGAAAAALRRAGEGIVHRMRRRGARAASQVRPVRKVIIICHGNVCRSPFGEAALRRELQKRGRPDVVATSAGFIGLDRAAPDMAISVAREMGLDLTGHRSVLVTAAMLQASDLVVVMSPEQAIAIRWRGVPNDVPVVVLGDLDPLPVESRSIVDPWGCDEQTFRASYERVDRCIVALATCARWG